MYSVTMEMENRKRTVSETEALSVYFRLESESSIDSQDDTESVYSIQNHETDIARDTTDTESSVWSDSAHELVTLEYDVASLSSDLDEFPDYTSSGTEEELNIQAATEGAIAAVLLDTSLEPWESDGESSEGSTALDAFEWVDVRKDFWTCVQCKSRKENPSYRFCEKCFQKCWQCNKETTFRGFRLCVNCFKVRKTFFPPRPKPSRKRKLDVSASSQPHKQKVHLDTLQDCLNELKKNGGGAPVGQLPDMNFQDIVVPTSPTKSHDSRDLEEDGDAPATKRQRIEPHSEDELDETSKHNVIASSAPLKQHDSDADASREVTEEAGCSMATMATGDLGAAGNAQPRQPDSDSGVSTKHSSDVDAVSMARDADLCIMCANAPKNGIFLHGNKGHMCCCYKCAMRAWKTCKRCPVCNGKVQKVVKLFTT